MEIAEAEQWVRDHPHWKPSKLMDEAKKQNWDPSVQGLVAFPDVLGTVDPGYELDHAAWQRFSRPASGRDAGGAAHAVPKPRPKGRSVRPRRRPSPRRTRTASRRSASSRQIRMSGTCRITIPHTCGDHRPGGITRRSLYPGMDVGLGLVSRHRSWSVFWRLGRLGMGRLGLGTRTGTAGISSSTILSFIVTVSEHFHEGGGPLGSSAWMHNPEHRLGVPYANREVAGRFARKRCGGGAGRSAAPGPRASIAGRWRLSRRIREIRVLSSAARPAITVSSAVITTVG